MGAGMKRLPTTARRQCSKCGELKVRSAFQKHPNTRDKLRSACRDCERPQQREVNLRRKYGMSVADYDAMFSAQGGRCAICRKKPKGDKSLHVDHDHTMGCVRGLLCTYCNVALGIYEAQHEAMAAYLEATAKKVMQYAREKNTTRS